MQLRQRRLADRMAIPVTATGVTVAAAHTGTLVTIGHGTELMDTHHSSRGIAFIDRFSLSQVSCPAIAPLVMRRTGADVKSAPHALWLDS